MNGVNRPLWLLIGLVLLALGALGALASLGRLPFVSPDTTLLTAEMVRRWHSAGRWAPAVTAAAGLLVAGLGAWLLSAQLPTRGEPMPDPVLVEPGTSADEDRYGQLRVTVPSRVLSRALSRDLSRDYRVRSAGVRLTGQPRRPSLHVNLALRNPTDLVSLGEMVENSMHRWVNTTGRRAKRSDVVVRAPDEPPTRVGGRPR